MHCNGPRCHVINTATELINHCNDHLLRKPLGSTLLADLHSLCSRPTLPHGTKPHFCVLPQCPVPSLSYQKHILTGRLRNTRRNLRSRLSRSAPSPGVKYVIKAVTRPLWMISNGDMSASLTMSATSFRLAPSSPG